jgi:O-acetyl-ADP-ribose deacetylase
LECKSLGGTPTGTTKFTRGYNLPAKYILHTVGPVGHGEELLAQSYRSVMKIVGEKEDIRTVALCGVSTGIFGFDLRVATNIALREVRSWLDVPGNADKVDKVIFCTFLEREIRMYASLMPSYFPIPANEK